MDIHLTPELEELVQSKVRSGRYDSASEVVREALRLMRQEEEVRAVQLRGLRNRIDQSLSEADRGAGVDGESFIRGLISDLDTAEAKRKAG